MQKHNYDIPFQPATFLLFREIDRMTNRSLFSGGSGKREDEMAKKAFSSIDALLKKYDGGFWGKHYWREIGYVF